VTDPIAVALVVLSVLFVLGAGLVVWGAVVCGARDDRLMEAWRAERERSQAAMDEHALHTGGEGWRNR
jgi:hypothetical protein